MQVVANDIENQKKELHIEVDWVDIQPDYNDVLSEYLKVPVPGFRPGKAPKIFIESRFKKEILDDVASRCAERFSRKALEAEGVAAAGPISITDIELEKNGPLQFKAEFTVLPDFELPDYSQFKLSTQTDDEKRDQISDWLLQNTVIGVPDELIRQELEFDSKSDVPVNSDEWGSALQRVKLLLILKNIANHDGIEVDDKDINERVEKMASAFETTASKLRQQLMQSGGLSRITNFLLAEKTLDYLLDICS
jgi:FKBP-type peptidyl-prolyl cis-trans isomerase (trigger factor)